eukprot:TRINITY_DN4584_c0_g1_i2.p1 TRINITY_DN4584_c0_g1~~TRINITY_DN4584_c0_g1_i2.p1  ORF type:complete len:286 (+),score=30.05 TRINITY_DN4584_c0_g1_i2:34-891(+)
MQVLPLEQLQHLLDAASAGLQKLKLNETVASQCAAELLPFHTVVVDLHSMVSIIHSYTQYISEAKNNVSTQTELTNEGLQVLLAHEVANQARKRPIRSWPKVVEDIVKPDNSCPGCAHCKRFKEGTLVWARYLDHPFWPAKVKKLEDGKAIVEFFAEQTTASMPLHDGSRLLTFSEKPPPQSCRSILSPNEKAQLKWAVTLATQEAQRLDNFQLELVLEDGSKIAPCMRVERCDIPESARVLVDKEESLFPNRTLLLALPDRVSYALLDPTDSVLRTFHPYMTYF